MFNILSIEYATILHAVNTRACKVYFIKRIKINFLLSIINLIVLKLFLFLNRYKCEKE